VVVGQKPEEQRPKQITLPELLGIIESEPERKQD